MLMLAQQSGLIQVEMTLAVKLRLFGEREGGERILQLALRAHASGWDPA